MVREAWEAIKAEEKAERAKAREKLGMHEKEKTYLDAVPHGMPSMKAAVKLQKTGQQGWF